MRLIVKNEQVVIIDRKLSREECLSIKSVSAQWIVEAFIKYINIDISDYRSHEYENILSGTFILHIRKEDLSKLREDKLSKLFE